MLFKRRGEAPDICVLQVSTAVLALDGTVMSDQNAASDYARFLDPRQWRLLDFDDIYAEDWRHPDDRIAYWRHKARKCAEVLVPHRVDSGFVVGAYVVDNAAESRLLGLGFALPITTAPMLFFRQGVGNVQSPHR